MPKVILHCEVTETMFASLSEKVAPDTDLDNINIIVDARYDNKCQLAVIDLFFKAVSEFDYKFKSII